MTDKAMRPKINKRTVEKESKETAVINNAIIARDRQLAEPPSPPITRLMKHEVKVGDSVCYFADVEDVWEVTEIRGPWLRARKHMQSPPGEANQCFLTDTMVPLELARRLPVRKADGSVGVPTPPRPRGRRKATDATETDRPVIKKHRAAAAVVEDKQAVAAEEAPRPRLRRPRQPKVAGTATAAEKKVAVKFCAKYREDHGKCETVRATAQKFPTMTQDEIVEVVGQIGINRSTAIFQYVKVHDSTRWSRQD